jgi:hypothetical protein
MHTLQVAVDSLARNSGFSAVVQVERGCAEPFTST